jgi:hypothetical protein
MQRDHHWQTQLFCQRPCHDCVYPEVSVQQSRVFLFQLPDYMPPGESKRRLRDGRNIIASHEAQFPEDPNRQTALLWP